MSEPVLRFERDGHVAIVTIDRPDARNAINPEVAGAIEQALDEIESDPELRVGLLTSTHGGEPPVFCAGADLKSIKSGQVDQLSTERGGFAGYVFRERAKPMVVAVDGLASSGGCELVLASDIVVASRRSSFGLAEVRWNLVAGAGGLYRLPAAVGPAVARDMMLTAEPITGERAYQLGLVSRLVDDGASFEAALAICHTVAGNGPLAVRHSRAVALTAAADEVVGRAATAKALDVVLSSNDLSEGLAAFVERRPPVWSGT